MKKETKVKTPKTIHKPLYTRTCGYQKARQDNNLPMTNILGEYTYVNQRTHTKTLHITMSLSREGQQTPNRLRL